MSLVDPWSPQDGAERARRRFVDRFGEEPAVVTMAPGRVNLIGEHTDYNDGLCLPIALPYATYAAARGRVNGGVRLTTGGGGKDWAGGLGDLATAPGWTAYAGGVVWALAEMGWQGTGIDLAFEGCVPSGAGLSSSAALECATGFAVFETLGVDAEPRRGLLAKAGVKAENEVAGAATGGMDQMVAMLAEEGRALLLDCESWQTRQIPFDPAAAGLELLVVDTRVHHSLNDGGYESRRRDCERAAEALGVRSLRDATADDVAGIADEQVRRRARHVVTEIARVSTTVESLEAGDWESVGRLMVESHASMRDDFEISVPELDAVVSVALEHGALGARMTGGGFGGSAIALVAAGSVDDVRGAVDAAFAERGWRPPSHLDGTPSGAARRLS